jgi:parallel beta-helix repeat protein
MIAGSATHVLRGLLTVGALLVAVLLPRQVSAQVEIYPGQNIQSVVNGYPAGTTFRLKAGIHRMQTIWPRNGDQFYGEPGTIMTGARELTNWMQSGSYWYAEGQTQQGLQKGECQAGYPRCTFPEQLFINGERLEHVAALNLIEPPNWAIKPGEWYFDYNADRIYVSPYPFGLTIETSVTPSAFEPTADNVTVSGLTIEMYAGAAQQGAINATGRSGWVITGNEVRRNHGPGISVGPNAQVRQNYIHNNGQLGIGGSGNNIVIEYNAIYRNNTAHFYPAWEAGGVKFTATSNLIVRGNHSFFNDGPGLWTDHDNIDTLYENNTSEDNTWMGILHEISYAAIIRNNTIRRNGFGFDPWIIGAGILVTGSPNVEIYGNFLDGNADGIGAAQQNRGSGAYGPHEIWNLWVHDNTVLNTKGWTGVVQDVNDNSVFTSRNNRFENNQYQTTGTALPFTWMNQELTEAGWKSFGQDLTGLFVQ